MVNAINDVYGVPVTAALKFCRILLCYGGKPISQKLNRLKIVQSILSYISCDAGYCMKTMKFILNVHFLLLVTDLGGFYYF